jgi:2-amino-4-hydroxy-6-hydroxymethyldihydropteridine diphosphokinase
MPEPAPERVVWLSLGSNVGDREGSIARALTLLGEHGVRVEAVSSLYETEPVGEILDQPDFLNAAARGRTTLEPLELLDACKVVEAELGRAFAGPRHGPRPIDVDVLMLGDVELEHERLTLPHPELRNRQFVLAPVLELDPGLTLPDGTRLAELRAPQAAGQRVERVAPPPSVPSSPL